MTLQRKYWLLQALGWGVYSIVGAGFAAYYSTFGPALIIGYVLFFCYSIALTDLFRREIKRRRWLELPTYPPAPRVLRLGGGVVLIGLIQALSVLGISYLLVGSGWDQTAALYMWLSVTYATGMWTVFYLQFTARRRHKEREASQQLSLREAQLHALESQINPHFLFNCLNSIRALVVENPPAAQDMLTRLANILRHSLQQDQNHTVPLAAEVSAASDYLALESVRFEERLRVQVDVDRDVEAFPVPPMLLQTLVENAVKHGIAPRREGGDLRIRAHMETSEAGGAMLRLNVENTGSLPTSASMGKEERGGNTADRPLGLANTRERLRLLYQGRAALELTSHDNLVIATVLLPASV